MLLKQLMDVYEVIDRADASGSLVKELLESYGGKNITVKKITGEKGSTDFVKIKIAGKNGKSKGEMLLLLEYWEDWAVLVQDL